MLKKTILILILIIAAGLFLYFKYPTTSPFKSATYLILSLFQPHKKLSKESIGFLAYWRMDDEDIASIHFETLSQIIYFSLSVGQDGHLIKVVNNQTDPGWLRWKGPKVRNLIARTQIMGAKFSLSVAMQKNKTIESFLNNPTAQQNLIDDLKLEIKETKIDGINLDFEYAGDVEPQYRQKFSHFLKKFTSSLRVEFPDIELSLDVFPLAVRKPRLVDIPKVSSYFDKVVIMAYDFYAAYSDTTGPIAPMSGYPQKKFLFDIQTAYLDFSKYVEPKKLILGIPYYGYDWPVEIEAEYMSKTLEQNDQNGYVEVLSYSRMRKEQKFNSQSQCQWDDLAKEPWCWYIDQKTNTARQVWFENNRSLEAKFNFVNQKNLGGFAIWLLGYDRDYQDLWNMISTKFTK